MDDILRSTSAIFHLTAFDDELRNRYSGLVIDLKPLYESGDDPQVIYAAMAEAVLDTLAHLPEGHTAAFLTYGHTLFLVDSNWELLRRVGEIGRRAKAIAATSFLDQVLVDLRSRFDGGFQSYESNLFYRERIRLDERMPLLLSQVGDFGSSSLRPTSKLLERVHPLFDRLSQVYPAERECALIFSAWRSDVAPQCTWTSIGELSTLVSSVHVGCSLFVAGERLGG
ncbi:SAM-dependent methyltransferase [Frondihabitans cladoniiphilus]|uniref:hypothetical protein n=1 Tax=Frondihabitans cladoniiphilus TaxID=715785 RepID=UPI003CD06705